MHFTNKQKWMATGVAIVTTATFLILPPFRGAAQKSKKDTTQNKDSKKNKRKSVTVDEYNRTFRIENGDLEKSLAELEKSLAEMEKQDFGKISETVEKALRAVDMDKMLLEVEKAMKSVNMEHIQLEVEQALKAVDMEKIQAEVSKAMKEVHMTKIKSDKNKAMKEVDWKAIHQEVNNAKKEAKISIKEMKNINIDEIKREMEKAKAEIERSKAGMKEEMLKAKGQIEKAKVQLLQMKEMLTEMEKDGLLKKGEQLNINWKDGKLYINDKEQPQSVSDKYKKYRSMDVDSDLDDDNDL